MLKEGEETGEGGKLKVAGGGKEESNGVMYT